MTDAEIKNPSINLNGVEIKKLAEDALRCLEPFEVRDIVAQMQETINRQQAEIETLKAEADKYYNAAKIQQDVSMKRYFEIKRLKEELAEKSAEIERLREYEDIRPTGCPNCNRGNFSNSKFCSHCGIQLQGKKKNIKAEAIKEFAERLKENLDDFYYSSEDALLEAIDLIDNLVKEMVGE